MAEPRTTTLAGIKRKISEATLRQHMFENRDVWLSSTEIADVFGCSLKHIRTFMRPLVDAGLIDSRAQNCVALWRWREQDATHLAWQKFTRLPCRYPIQGAAA